MLTCGEGYSACMTSKFDRFFGLVRNNINNFGVHLQWVGDAQPPFAYSVGMLSFEHPEFIVFQTSASTSQWLLNNFAFRVRDKVQGFAAGEEVHGLLAEHSVYLLEVIDSTKHLTVTNRMYRRPGGPPVRALQVVLPDRHGCWPWEEGCELPQPLLGHAPSSPAKIQHVRLVEHDPN